MYQTKLINQRVFGLVALDIASSWSDAVAKLIKIGAFGRSLGQHFFQGDLTHEAKLVCGGEEELHTHDRIIQCAVGVTLW